MSRIAQCVFGLLLVAVPLTAQETPETDLFAGDAVLDRDALAAAVAERNPSLDSARQAWRAASARVPQVTSLSNPMVSYSFAPLSVASDDVPFGNEVQFRQAIPYPGKLRARGAMAEAEAEEAFQDYREALLELTAQAALLYDDWYLLHRALEVNTQHLELLDSFRETAAARYAAGLASQQDPLQAEVEAAKLLQLEAELDSSRRVVAARLNALLHRDPGAPLPPPPARLEIPLAALAANAAGAAGEDAGALQDLAVASRPELEGIAASIRAREAGLEMAELERQPDFEVMASFSTMWMETEHRFMAGVAVDLPIRRGRIDAARVEAEARLAEALSRRSAAEDEIRAEVREAWERLQEAARQIEIQRNRVLPATRDQIRAARTGFETGGTFLAVIEAERNLREAELREHELVAEFHRRQTLLNRLLGRLPAGLADSSEGERR